jgi:hypothetical protein
VAAASASYSRLKQTTEGSSVGVQAGVPEDSPQLAAECQRKSSRIIKVIGLMPFIQTNPTNRKQRFMRHICDYAGALAAVAHALEFVPRSVRRFLLGTFAGDLDVGCLAVTDSLVRWDSTRTAFTLAKHEFIDLDDPSIWELVSRLRGRYALLLAWWHLRHRNVLVLVVAHSLVSLMAC